jgi:hypothetical protein
MQAGALQTARMPPLWPQTFSAGLAGIHLLKHLNLYDSAGLAVEPAKLARTRFDKLSKLNGLSIWHKQMYVYMY